MSTAILTRHDESSKSIERDPSAGEVVLEALRTRTGQLWDAEHAVRDAVPDAVPRCG
jgi:hypothetical protein